MIPARFNQWRDSSRELFRERVAIMLESNGIDMATRAADIPDKIIIIAEAQAEANERRIDCSEVE